MGAALGLGLAPVVRVHQVHQSVLKDAQALHLHHGVGDRVGRGFERDYVHVQVRHEVVVFLLLLCADAESVAVYYVYIYTYTQTVCSFDHSPRQE